MSQKYPGGIISKTAPVTVGPVDGEGGSAPGIWTLDQALELQKQNLWPKPPLPKQLWSWGYNNVGELGLNNTNSASSPVQVGALTIWEQVAAGRQHCLAVQNNGTLWSWGNNNSGQLGRGALGVYVSSPTQVGALTNWYLVAAGNSISFSIKTDGTLWAWGQGAGGRQGQGDATQRSSPVQVGASTNWAQVTAGGATTGAIETTGALFTWGNGLAGTLGLGNTTSYSSPKQVGALTNWKQVSMTNASCFAVKTDGTLWSWGANDHGILGLNQYGPYTGKSSPNQIGALTNWSSVSAGIGYFCCAIKTDGTLWSWGRLADGALGQNSAISRSSPVQIGALTNWSKVAAGNYFCVALKTDGTLWAWGRGTGGRLGQGDTQSRSSPVQVGSLTTWLRLPTGVDNNSAVAIKAP